MRLVDLAFLDEGDAEVVVGLGVIRFQADGFLVLADRLVDLAFLVEGGAEVVVREVIVLRDFERMPEQGFTVLPITDLLPRQRQAEDDRRTTRHRQRHHLIPPAPGQFVRAPDREDQHPKRRNISIADPPSPVRPLCTNPITGTSVPQTTATPSAKRDTAAAAPKAAPKCPDQPTRQQHLPQRPMPGVRIENRQIRGPEQLPQIAAVRNQRVPDARAQGQVSTVIKAPARCCTTKVTTLANAARTKNGIFSHTSCIQGTVQALGVCCVPLGSAFRIPHFAFLPSGQ